MVKWYTSLFITRNTSVLTSTSIDLILYPWAITDNFPQYYGLGTELMFSVAYWSSPEIVTWSPVNLTSVYYMGGSMCTFFTIVIWNSSVNPFGGPPMTTLPVTVAVARNNRILNVTEEEWKMGKQTAVGTWNEITQNGDPYYQNEGWSDPECCGSNAPSLADTEWVAFDLAWYFGTIPFGGAPTGQPVKVPSQSNSNDDTVSDMGIKAGSTAVILLVFGIIIAVFLIAYFSYSYGKQNSFLPCRKEALADQNRDHEPEISQIDMQSRN